MLTANSAQAAGPENHRQRSVHRETNYVGLSEKPVRIHNPQQIEKLHHVAMHQPGGRGHLAAGLLIGKVFDPAHLDVQLKTVEQHLPAAVTRLRELHAAGRIPFWDRVDIHMHTGTSDGYISEPGLAWNALLGAGLQCFSKTDHDWFPKAPTQAGAYQTVLRINKEFKESGIRPAHYIPGTEVSVLHNGLTIHLLTYWPQLYQQPGAYEQLANTLIVKHLTKKFENLAGLNEEMAIWVLREMNKHLANQKWFTPIDPSVLETLRAVNLGNSSASDAIYKVHEKALREQGYTENKQVWYNLVPSEIKAEVYRRKNSGQATLAEAIKLANDTNAKVVVAHPSEIWEQEVATAEPKYYADLLLHTLIDQGLDPSRLLGSEHPLLSKKPKDDAKARLYGSWVDHAHAMVAADRPGLNLESFPGSDDHNGRPGSMNRYKDDLSAVFRRVSKAFSLPVDAR